MRLKYQKLPKIIKSLTEFGEKKVGQWVGVEVWGGSTALWRTAKELLDSLPVACRSPLHISNPYN